MHPELADEIARLAAPILAALLAPYLASGRPITSEALGTLRATAIEQAQALRLDALDAPAQERR